MGLARHKTTQQLGEQRGGFLSRCQGWDAAASCLWCGEDLEMTGLLTFWVISHLTPRPRACGEMVSSLSGRHLREGEAAAAPGRAPLPSRKPAAAPGLGAHEGPSARNPGPPQQPVLSSRCLAARDDVLLT